jgi:glycine dehydrogenase subunit 1
MFTPNTEAERKEMLKAIGIQDIKQLFSVVPEQFRFPKLNIPGGLSEMEALAQLEEISQANNACNEMICFLGAGAYDHYIPAAIDGLLRRGEFFTAYTPYQPEISQGTLQTIFEYQSLIAHLTGMEVCNASHYDGATAAAEACLSAYYNFQEKRNKFILSPSLHPDYRDTIYTYLCGFEGLTIEGGLPEEDIFSSPDELISKLDSDTALIVIQYPDFLGRVFDYSSLIMKAHEFGCLVAVAVNPMALGILKAPGEFGADFVVGDGQPLGLPLSFGGPYLGLFATRKELIRKVSGRIVGETVDSNGKRGYVLTLTAREQHIRREKASSNICTNQGLMALAVTIYLSLLGKQGFRNISELCYQKAHYAAKKINSLIGYKLESKTEFFNEFVISCPKPVKEINDHLLEEGFIGGFDLGEISTKQKSKMLIAVTEKITKEMIDVFCEELEEAANE